MHKNRGTKWCIVLKMSKVIDVSKFNKYNTGRKYETGFKRWEGTIWQVLEK